MARYQLRRPSPVKVFPKRTRRQAAAPATSSAPAEAEEEEDEGPESPDSPFSSPSTVGGSSDDDSDSDSDSDEAPSPVESSAPAGETSVSQPSSPSISATSSSAFTLAPTSSPSGNIPVALESTSQPTPASRGPTQVLGPDPTPSSQTRPSNPAFTRSVTSQGNVAVAPQITGSAFRTVTTQPATTATIPNESSAQSEMAGERDPPQKSSAQEEKTLITRGGAAAAITLSILGAIAIIAAVFICIKRRKRRQNQYRGRLADDAFNPGNTASLRSPEVAHVTTETPFALGAAAGGSHLTRSTERSNTLFGAGPYVRPETVSTERNNSRYPNGQPTPNPFADPPLNKAYDVLGGRPRSTTLTDRGSWVKNPFKDPQSERFDPFGELQEKARQERRRYLEESRREAELAREFGAKEKMGLAPPEGALRKGSDATVSGLGVLDRSGGGGGYR
ncbi:hypothetical protein GQ44DRAFT_760896 [Phaeosphaeriaceae sp. PMI808]|nr:hypothetical protein GQ44DRAFT_760896 [Phaeosphaeriaceae sp. PMI808]